MYVISGNISYILTKINTEKKIYKQASISSLGVPIKNSPSTADGRETKAKWATKTFWNVMSEKSRISATNERFFWVYKRTTSNQTLNFGQIKSQFWEISIQS